MIRVLVAVIVGGLAFLVGWKGRQSTSTPRLVVNETISVASPETENATPPDGANPLTSPYTIDELLAMDERNRLQS